VYGGFQLRENEASGTTACDADRAGAIRWNGTQFQTCFGSGGWALLSSAATSGTTAVSDRITSGTAQVIARSNADVSVTTNLDVSGTIKVAGTGSDVCSPANHGTIRRNPTTGALQVCH
jgi:hypothetical protein